MQAAAKMDLWVAKLGSSPKFKYGDSKPIRHPSLRAMIFRQTTSTVWLGSVATSSTVSLLPPSSSAFSAVSPFSHGMYKVHAAGGKRILLQSLPAAVALPPLDDVGLPRALAAPSYVQRVGWHKRISAPESCSTADLAAHRRIQRAGMSQDTSTAQQAALPVLGGSLTACWDRPSTSLHITSAHRRYVAYVPLVFLCICLAVFLLLRAWQLWLRMNRCAFPLLAI